MTTSGTYSFAPSAGDVVLNAFSMCQVRRTMLTQEHLEDAYMQANLLNVDFSNRNPNGWALETQDLTLTPGTATYNLASRTVCVAIAYIRTTASGVDSDRVIGPLSATDYGALPDKARQAPPVSFFFSLLSPTPTVTFWPVPDLADTYTARLQTFRQMQDVVLAGGVGLDSPYRFLDAFTTGLAARLALIYPENLPSPNRPKELQDLYEARFSLAAQRDQESTVMTIRPMMGSYYR